VPEGYPCEQIGGPVVSQHRDPHPRVRRIVSGLLALGLITAIAASAAQVILAWVTAGWLFCGTALLTAILVIPLLMGTVLHPEIGVSQAGLHIQPMIWRAQFVPWNAFTGIIAHPLVTNDETMERILYGKRYRRREGIVVVAGRESGLGPVYRLVGSLAGAGNTPAFALSSTTHTDYETLVATIREHLDASSARPARE
jgi:hypothetical protein